MATPQPVTVFSLILLLLPLFYLFLASPAFLFVRLDIPQLARLLRAMFYGYFLALIVAGFAGVAGRLRLMHVAGMLVNAMQRAAVIAGVPLLVTMV